MNRTATSRELRHDNGYILVAMMALIAAILGTGAAFMQWSSDESQQSHQAEASMQAYYVAQAGIIESGLNWLNQQQAGLLPRAQQQLGGGEVPGVGRYKDVLVTPIFGTIADPNNFSYSEKYRITATGEVDAPWWDESGSPESKKVYRKAVLYVQVRSFVDYMYLTNYETSITFPGDIVRFWGCDTLWGRTHSNDWIATQSGGCNAQLPVFYDIVSTTKPTFRPGSPDPAGFFYGGDPRFNAPEVLLPELADPIRQGAAERGYLLEVAGHEWRCVIEGATANFYYYPEGTEFDPISPPPSIEVLLGNKPCVFVKGKLDLLGVMSASGCAITIGCSEDIRLIDDLMLQGTDMNSGTIPIGATSIIGVVSEKWIYVANTWENGRENRTGATQDHEDIVITAALVALRGSFQLEQMNDIGDNYICPTPPPQDERGDIVLTGSVTQYNRGYVHRQNHGGTGYKKVYHYDERFRYTRPPCFLGAVDDEGRALFNITQWGQASEDPVDVNNDPPVRVKYN